MRILITILLMSCLIGCAAKRSYRAILIAYPPLEIANDSIIIKRNTPMSTFPDFIIPFDSTKQYAPLVSIADTIQNPLSAVQ